MNATLRLEYAQPTDRSSAGPLYGAVLFFCGGPLVFGIFCFLGFLFTHFAVFAILGFLTLFGGFLSACIGAALLARYWATQRAFAPVDSSIRRRALFALILLLSNFPAAFACAYVGLNLLSGPNQ